MKEGEDREPVELRFDKEHAIFTRGEPVVRVIPIETRRDMAETGNKILAALRDAEGELSQNMVEKSIPGRHDRIREVLDVLRLWGAIHRRAGKRGALMFDLASDFRTSKARREAIVADLANPNKPLPREAS